MRLAMSFILIGIGLMVAYLVVSQVAQTLTGLASHLIGY
jgi:hypothetical protein